MSSQLFAFNVSKIVENPDEKANEQWVGDGTTRAYTCQPCYCSGGQGYGLSFCIVTNSIQCTQAGSTGYYLCDPDI
jgi:hypothetical protein